MTRDQITGWRMANWPLLAIVLTWAMVSALIVLTSPHIGAQRFPDGDDAMRLVQVRDLLAGQGWFDLYQYRLNPPEGTLMHWSRLVDLPIAGLIWVLALVLPMPTAEIAAAFITPLLLLLLTMLAVGKIALDRFGLLPAILACAAFAVLPLLPGQFQPLRIDHHGWQVLTVAVALWAIAMRNPARGAMIAGLAMAIGLMVSLETVVMAAGFGLVLTWRWMRDHRHRAGLARYLQSLAGGLVLIFLLTRGLADLAPHCDAVSPPHLGFFLVMATGVSALAAMQVSSRAVLLAGLAVTAIAGIALIGWSAPRCLAPPFAGLDPLVRDYWYLKVSEGMPIWHQPFVEAMPAVVQCVFALGVTLHLAIRSERNLRAWWSEYAVLLGLACIGGLVTYRSVAFAGMLSAVPLGWFAARMMARWQSATGLPAKLVAAACLYIAFLPGVLNPVLEPLFAPGKAQGKPTASNQDCDIYQNARLLNRLSAATLFAPLDIGPGLLLGTHHSIVASSHHRAEAGMRDVIDAFIHDPSHARERMAAHDADYVVVCLDAAEMSIYRSAGGSASLAALLEAGQPPAWLEPVQIVGQGNLRVWRILPDAPAAARAVLQP
ncbi:hypothetical protein [Blastomonas aquatica]|uniref:AcrB/AcrD/AcrF family protein n=1 Tax=Blastomonas aquatica TaxID=1510276 RepID=A0ABQ1IXI7_9SPHN|nr:hypothetical protein [Blastomonas aquatica]GGB55067.1 hypothetical protein GCM10010833_07180 [Blastomonas aquatica]